MSTATATGPAQRYGSAAELAAYAGLSVKTIRRLVESGRVRGRKLGRRLLIPFEDLDRLILPIEEHRRPAMPPQTEATQASTDASGRAVTRSEVERMQRARLAIQALDGLDAIGSATEQRATLKELIRGIDGRPMSGRKRFRG